MSSTEPYPEVTADESGIVPHQSSRAPEWPKKIRTLTATELDRLTIDSEIVRWGPVIKAADIKVN